ncbi:NF038122 family metalloprotease [Acidisphaera sp. S103]|uniref:NF038122 family metalloprotease n=1 Tax=Acidisphaera sp. S103 TaxID=1747223 RepID=UPI00131A9B42|nr:NF038122 family metalloprotease [Acidisphaera sp. S103]
MNQNTKTGGFIALAMLGGAALLPAPAFANLVLDVTYDFSYDPGITLAQENQVETAFNGVAQQFEAAITNPITVNVQVSVGTINGTTQTLPSGNDSGNEVHLIQMGPTAATSLAATEAALASTGATLPAAPATGGATFYMPQAEFKALGLSPANFSPLNPIDGYIGFSSNLALFSFLGTPSGGAVSFQAVAEHEIEEVLGRLSSLNDGGVTSSYEALPFDLFRYSSPGVSSYSENAAAYASTDGGVTDLGTFEYVDPNADRSDWLNLPNPTSTDAQNSGFTQNVNEGLSISDEDVLKGLGYTIAANNGGNLFDGSNAPVGATPSVNNPRPVPEPGTLSLLAVGAGFAGLMRRRGRRSVLA